MNLKRTTHCRWAEKSSTNGRIKSLRLRQSPVLQLSLRNLHWQKWSYTVSPMNPLSLSDISYTPYEREQQTKSATQSLKKSKQPNSNAQTMRKRFWKTEKFKAIKEEWYQKLSDSGFVDIEKNERLKQRADNSYRTKDLTLIENKSRYFDLLGQWAHEEEFKTEIHRIVIERRSQGVKIKDIVLELKRLHWLRRKRHSDTVRCILRHYEKKWGVKRR